MGQDIFKQESDFTFAWTDFIRRPIAFIHDRKLVHLKVNTPTSLPSNSQKNQNKNLDKLAEGHIIEKRKLEKAGGGYLEVKIFRFQSTFSLRTLLL